MPITKLDRLTVFHRERKPEGEPTRRVVLVHGNVSTSAFFEPLMAALPASWHVVAPDLRGFGATDSAPIDATRGLRDFADDVHALIESLGWVGQADLLGWSVGGGVILQLAIDHPSAARSLTLVNPVPPRGFGGTRDVDGTPTEADFAGSGGGAVSPDFLASLRLRDRSSGVGSARFTMKQFFFAADDYQPPPELEEQFLDAMQSTRLGDWFYPGDSVASANWPFVAPGTRGMNNAFSPKYQDLSAFAEIAPQPRVWWVRGAKDSVVSDSSFFDLAQLGKLGLVPGWPGEERCPPQPMVAQTRTLLDRYAAGGGSVTTHVFERAGHSPFLECQDEFVRAFVEFVG